MDEVLSQISNQVYEFDTLGLVQQYIFELSEHFKENHNAYIDIQQFVIFFINQTNEQGIEGLILISKLIELYQEILSQQNEKILKLKHITDYLISSQEICSEYFNAKFLPSQNNQIQLTRRVLTDIEIQPPEILGLNPSMLRRLETQLKIENIHINNQVIYGIKGDNDLFLILQFCESVCMLHEFSFKKMLQPRNMIDGNFVVYAHYSTKQQRLGVILRNNTLIFWDKRDNYTYDYQIETQLELQHITFIEMQDLWITSANKSLQIWNLEQGKYQNLQNQVFSGGIIQLLEVLHLQMLLVASNPNIISCWDMFEQKFLFKFQVQHQILYQVVCSKQFQLIFTIGFNNYISCYELHAQYNDYNLKCQLVGHCSTVQCIEHIERTALLISIDTKNVIILWDIRSQQQTQTINLQTRILTKQLMFYCNKLCLVTNMLQTLNFEKQLHPNKQIKLMQVIYDQWNKRNIIITKADIRIQDIITGKIQYILSDFQNEISSSCLIEHGYAIIIGTTEGDLYKISLKHGQILQQWESFYQEEIISIQYDETYKILHIVSIQGILKCLPLTQLNVCKDNIYKDKWAIRQLSVNVCINICQLSIIQGLLAISYEDFIQIWNLEYYCVSIQIQLEDNAIATSMIFCDSLPLLIIGTNQADIFIFQLVQKNDKLQCTLEGHLNIVKAVLIQKLKSVYPDRLSIMNNLFSKTSLELIELYDEGDEQIEVKRLFNNKYKLMSHGSFASRLLVQFNKEELKLYIATNRGSALVFNITQLLEKKNISKKLDQINQRPNYNPYRVVYNSLQGNFIDNYQIVQNRLIKDQVKKRESKFEQTSKIKQKFRNSLIRFSILKGLKDNPELDITHTLKDSIFSFDEQLETAEQIHNDMVIQLNFLFIDPYEILFQKKTQFLIAGCQDDTVKVFNADFNQICQFSIHNPIPYQWQSLLNEKNKVKATILFSLELLKQILPQLNSEKRKAYDVESMLKQNSIKHINKAFKLSNILTKKEPINNQQKLKDSFLNKRKISLCNNVKMPQLSPKLPPSLRYYDEKIKQSKYQSEIHEQDLINQINQQKRQQGFQIEQQRQQKKEILDYLTPEVNTNPKFFEDLSIQALSARLKTESKTHQSKITKTTNDTKRTFTRQSLDFFDYAEKKEMLATRSKISQSRFQTRRQHHDFHKILNELHGKLKISKKQS
ncbi:unnamed protein product [Paramecium sonneborni]|uniref:Uncharacterized protein n=1 Tax=Paramecium sonneborni TaxID=65129 RepID=A0A8S1R6Q4_9CILI|nr:unnamed protein product [Paramecium sonneborni]